MTIHETTDNANLRIGVSTLQNKTMNLTEYLLIDDPMERIRKTSLEIRARGAEIDQLSTIRTAAVVEAYEAKIRPAEIALAGGFNISRMRQILKSSGHQKTHDWRHLCEATYFKKSE